jgi:hypothetical protein
MVAMKTWITFIAGGRVLAGIALLGLSGLAWGHGGEDHGDTPMAANGSGLPRVEAHTETFELVGQLDSEELSLLIDRYESNEPVLGARVTVESGGIEAQATFHADHGDYAVDDARLLALLRQPGEHALVFTVTLGADADLLDGTLRRPLTVLAAEHADGGWRGVGWAGAALLALAAAYVLVQRRARVRGLPQPGELA